MVMDLHGSASTEVTLAPDERVLVVDIVRYLDRVAFIPRDLVLAHASGRIGVAAFDRYRISCATTIGAIGDSAWAAVIETLCTRALALAVRI